ncbi:hypothetical protein C9374_008096 [Naegleria lovaniensis]|uniref:Uncharacterized protein n=1 Tax=Naegleria lovaniensis TaxID=51637 RepID=A0AA88GFE9_NAELO|nr:uncharacterized protein C9374_008096 [Naegleria lovaniensis]KAG2378457.1 hypothetical protein C9374_008096 [Naegleria lovaniensis]
MNQDELVKLILIDLRVVFRSDIHDPNQEENQQYSDRLLKFLQEKLRCKKFVPKAFSLNSELIETIEQKDLPPQKNGDHMTFIYICDVKISYNYDSIILSDYGTHHIFVFGLESKKFKTRIKTLNSPSYLCIEENYVMPSSDDSIEDANHNIQRGKDALLVVCESRNMLLKCDFKLLLQQPDDIVSSDDKSTQESTHDSILWSCDFDSCPQGMAIKDNHLFVCLASAMIKIMDCCTAKTISEIPLTFDPYGITFTNDGKTLLCSTFSHENVGSVYCIFEESENDWKIGKSFGTYTLRRPYSLLSDKVSNHIIVSDLPSSRIVIFTPDGQMVKSFQTASMIKPFGICLNERTGELIVCDHSSEMVFIFK